MKFFLITITILFSLGCGIFFVNNFAPEEEIELRPIIAVPHLIIEYFNPKEEYYIVNFFASWCNSCNAEHKNILEIHNKTHFPIYGIAINDHLENVNHMLRHNNPYKKVILDFPVPKLTEIKIERIPRILVVYKNSIIYDHAGEVNDKILNKKIMPLLEKIKEDAHLNTQKKE